MQQLYPVSRTWRSNLEIEPIHSDRSKDSNNNRYISLKRLQPRFGETSGSIGFCSHGERFNAISAQFLHKLLSNLSIVATNLVLKQNNAVA